MEILGHINHDIKQPFVSSDNNSDLLGKGEAGANSPVCRLGHCDMKAMRPPDHMNLKSLKYLTIKGHIEYTRVSRHYLIIFSELIAYRLYSLIVKRLTLDRNTKKEEIVET